MLPEIEQLLVLQDRDRKLRTLKQELKSAPIERKKLEEKLAGTQKLFDDAKLKGKEIEVERKKLENEVLGRQDQIRKYETQKSQTRKNDEFQALNTAIEHAQGDIRKLEDRELELMESAEQLKPQIAEAERAAQAARDLVTRQLTDLDAKIKAVEQQIKDIETDRKQIASSVEEDLLDTYQRLFTTKGEAVVALEHDVCTGCHVKVTASTAAAVKARRALVHCDQCGRILYPGGL